MKKELWTYVIMATLAIAGYFIPWTYFGGILTGACLTMLLFVSVGKKLAKKAAARIDKTIQDHLAARL